MSEIPYREACTFCNERDDKIDKLKAQLEQARKRPTYTLKVSDGISAFLTVLSAVWTVLLALFWCAEGWKAGVGRVAIIATVLWLMTAAAIWSGKKPND